MKGRRKEGHKVTATRTLTLVVTRDSALAGDAGGLGLLRVHSGGGKLLALGGVHFGSSRVGLSGGGLRERVAVSISVAVVRVLSSGD